MSDTRRAAQTGMRTRSLTVCSLSKRYGEPSWRSNLNGGTKRTNSLRVSNCISMKRQRKGRVLGDGYLATTTMEGPAVTTDLNRMPARANTKAAKPYTPAPMLCV